MILLSGADVVLHDRVIGPATLAVEGDRIVDVVQGPRAAAAGDRVMDVRDRTIVPGFIDVHVHGVEGIDALDGDSAVVRIAERLPRYGVTAFCPTSVACDPPTLSRLLGEVRDARTSAPRGARVLPAHLESNFINPEFKGAQPLACIRTARRGRRADGGFTGDQILDAIAAARPDVGIVTLAPEIDGALDLIRELVRHGHHVSLGHSGATYEEAIAGIDAGATQATHLFNRMPLLGHRAPGLAGAVLERDEVAVEVICDGVHVHPAMIKLALQTKGLERFMAITDGSAGSGLARGSKATLGGRTITVGDAAYLDDGTIAGSVVTMDRVFAMLVSAVGAGFPEAAAACSTTPARQLGLHGFGTLAPGSMADFVILDRSLRVQETWINGEIAFRSS